MTPPAVSPCGGDQQEASSAWRGPGGGGADRRPAASRAVLASGSGYRRLAFASAHVDALGVDFVRLGHKDLQDAVLGGGVDLVCLDVSGQRDRPAERAVAALGPVDLLSGHV